jgi:hypothetical protein
LPSRPVNTWATLKGWLRKRHNGFAHGHGNRPAGVDHFETAFQTFCARHGNRADHVVAQILLDFEGHFRRLVLNLVFDGQGVIDRGHGLGKFDVHHGTRNFNNLSFRHESTLFVRLSNPDQPDLPPAISSISLVILSWRSLLYSRDKCLIRLSALSVAFFIDTMRALCSLALAVSRTS